MALTSRARSVDFVSVHAHPTTVLSDTATTVDNEWLQVKSLPGKGRGFVAKRPIAAGTTIYNAKPLAVAVSQEWIPETCAYCFAFSYPKRMRVKASVTKDILFCSAECQTHFAHHGHQGESDLVSRSYLALDQAYNKAKEAAAAAAAVGPPTKVETLPRPPKDSSDTQLAGWLDAAWTAAAAKAESHDAQFHSDEWIPDRGEQTMCRLIAACLARKQCQAADCLGAVPSPTPGAVPFDQLWEMQCNELACVRAMMAESEEADGVPDQLLEIMCLYCYFSVAVAGILDCPHTVFRAIYFRESANSFGLWEMPHKGRGLLNDNQGVTDDQELLGWGIYPSAVYFNHACNANVVKIRNGRDMQFLAKTDIEAGQEACISYGSVGEAVEDRRARLLEHYHFWCECDRCKTESS